MTPLEMPNGFHDYFGVDISAVAIEKARTTLANERDRADKVQFAVGDIAIFKPIQLHSVILFRESLYYVPKIHIREVLHRHSLALAPNGVFIVRLCDKMKYKWIVQVLKKDFDLVEEYQPTDSPMTIIVVRRARS